MMCLESPSPATFFGTSSDSLQMVLHGFMCLSTFVYGFFIFILTSKSPFSRYTSVAYAIDLSVTASSTDFSFQNLVLWDLFEFSVAEII